MADDLIESYRLLVGALLEHTTLHKGTEPAVFDFLSADDPSSDILRHIIAAQSTARELGE
jgi:hypothetical protein